MAGLSIVVCAFFVGSIPSKRLVEKIWGIDLTQVGSGNPGAGNATRSVGLRAGIVVAVIDGLKGLIPVLAGRGLGLSNAELAMVGLASVAGNNWPIHLRRRGGRGLATSVGVVLAFDPLLLWWPGLWSLIGWRIGGGIAGFLGWGLLPIVTIAAGAPVSTTALAIGLSLMMMVRRAQGNTGLDRAQTRSRVLFDDEGHTSRPTSPRPRVVTVGALLLVAYGTIAWWVLERSDLPGPGLVGAALLALGIACEFGAKWAFGELFREGVVSAGSSLKRSSAFRAALVGAGIARLIPAGGAITPVAMAWAVRDEAPGSSGAALRATVLNYAGLLVGTGGGLLWVTTRFPDTRARFQTMIIALIALTVGLVLLVGAARLSGLARLVPHRWRDRVAAVLRDEAMTRRAFALLTTRVVLEAAALGLTLVAFGIVLSPSRTLAAFGASQLVGGLPGTPGGIGFTEAGLTGALAFFDIQSAIGPILVFRVISYWLPAIAGLSAGGYSFLLTGRPPATPTADGSQAG